MKAFLGTLLIAAALAAGGSATAQDGEKDKDRSTTEARAFFNRGVDLFREGAVDAARVQFRQAYATRPHFAVLYNIGQASMRLQDYAGALDAYQRYLRDGGTEVPAERRALVETELAKLRTRVAEITLDTSATAGEVLVDDAVVARLPLRDPFIVSAGRRKITVAPEGGAAVTRVIEVVGGQPVKLQLEAAPPAPAKTEAPPPPVVVESPPPETRASSGPWIALGTSAVLAVGAGVTGLVALSAKSDADAELRRFPGSRDDLDAAHSRMQTASVVADVLAGAALVAAGVSIYLFVSSPKASAAKASAQRLEVFGSGRTVTVRASF
ncbi:MAG: hypothetical protein IPG50_14635 [Myxococcales bacterium]|nr:hypothetical protein [Myxococcales bacterium]